MGHGSTPGSILWLKEGLEDSLLLYDFPASEKTNLFDKRAGRAEPQDPPAEPGGRRIPLSPRLLPIDDLLSHRTSAEWESGRGDI